MKLAENLQYSINMVTVIPKPTVANLPLLAPAAPAADALNGSD